ncbi:MAG TPA: selenocysteine protein [Thermoplasmata archaeon]|nr:selenocysteine protein [Thermoplasmata archaeon]
MMLLVDYFNVLTKGKMKNAVRGGKTRQYIVASFLGATPGCLGAFMNVSLYVHGLLTFGAIVGGMIATSGDEAFVMLTMFPREALLLFTLLFILGVVGGWLADKVAMFFNIVPCEECKFHEVHDIDGKHPFQPSVLRNFSKLSPVRYGLMLIFLAIIVSNLFGFWGPQSWSLEKPERIILISLSPLVVFIIATVSEHYLKEHVMDHIIRKHVWKIFLWTFFALFFVETGLRYWNLDKFVVANMGLILIISALIGLIPESGPHLVFVMMFANGLIPFSILLTSSIVQDGHGLLPLFSYTLKDSVLIKTFNLMFGLAVGVLFFFLGF